MITIPTLETERMILRGPKDSDFEPFAEFSASKRSIGVGGPATRAEAWRAMAMMIGHWEMRGYGMWWLEEKSSGKAVGRVGLWNPEGWPGRELGWVVYAGYEGRGFAYEAAVASRDHAYGELGWSELISLVAPNNKRCLALCDRLGATFSGTWTSPTGKEAHIYSHPGPEALK